MSLLLAVSAVAMVAAPWSAGPPLAVPRAGHSAMLLKDGSVLVCGGYQPQFGITDNCERLFPGATSWLDAGTMSTGRYDHRALQLPSGQVLICGGTYNLSNTSCDYWDPATSTVVDAGPPLTQARAAFTMTLLADAGVIAAGGTANDAIDNPLSSSELDTGTWSGGSSLNLPQPMLGQQAILLLDGRVLAVGGYTGSMQAVNGAALFEPDAPRWVPATLPHSARSYFVMTMLPGGDVLVLGGVDATSNGPLYGERFSPDSGLWSETTMSQHLHYGAVGGRLADGRVVVAGGYDVSGAVIPTTELYDPSTDTWSTSGDMIEARFFAKAVVGGDGRLLVIGGHLADGGQPTNSTEWFGQADAGGAFDGGPTDGGPFDGGATDGGAIDGGAIDGGAHGTDAGTPGAADGGAADGGLSGDGGPMGSAGRHELTLACGCGASGSTGLIWLIAAITAARLRSREWTRFGVRGLRHPARRHRCR